jgi:hypothetical protein
MNITCIKNNTINQHPYLKNDAVNNLHLVYNKRIWDQGIEYNEGIRYKMWNSTSKNWSLPEEISDSGASPKFCIDALENKHITWREGGISYRKWSNSTKSWLSIEQVNSYCDNGIREDDFTIDHNNNPYMVWSGDEIVGARRKYKNSWTSCERISIRSTEYKDYPTIVTDKFGNKHVAWSDWTPYGGSGEDADIYYRCWNITTSEWMPIKVISSDHIPYLLFILMDPFFQCSVIALSTAIVVIVVSRVRKRRNKVKSIQ